MGSSNTGEKDDSGANAGGSDSSKAVFQILSPAFTQKARRSSLITVLASTKPRMMTLRHGGHEMQILGSNA
ncbi:hypothetical protein SOVF_160730 [Spinacia oleracea]|nr:hypothetical protein SOVF_160730 [Spinacia oleracea]